MLQAWSGENFELPSGGESSRDLLPRLSSLIISASTDPSINFPLTVSHRAINSSLRTVCVFEDPNFHSSLQHLDMPFANSPSSGTSFGFIDATMIPLGDMVTPKMEQILEQASAHCSCDTGAQGLDLNMDMDKASSSTLFSAKDGVPIQSVLYRRNSNSTFMLLGDGTIRFVGQVPEYRSRFPHPPPLPEGLRYVSIEETNSNAMIAEISNGDMITFDVGETSLDMKILHRGRTAVTSESWMISNEMIYDSRMSIVSGCGGYWKMSNDQNNCPNWVWCATSSPVLEIASSKSLNTYGYPVVLLENGSICPQSSVVADFVPEGLKFSRLITTSPRISTENRYIIGVMECGMAIQLSPHEEDRRVKTCRHKDEPILLPTPGHKVLRVEFRSEWGEGRSVHLMTQELEAPDGSVVTTQHYAPDAHRHASRISNGGRGVNYKKFCSQHATEDWHSLMRDIVAQNPEIRPWMPAAAMKHGSMRGLVGLLEI